ncbi:MAG: hypothetical protein RLZZ350_399 [Verrucomicrobiota bacterium]|jgi:hypothetical protein
MKTPFYFPSAAKCIPLVALLLWVGVARAATLTVTPATVSNNYSGFVTLVVAGLTNGEPVVMQKFSDLNTNGVVDSTDFLIQQFTLTDGVAPMIGGVTNINVPGDTDTTGAQITAKINFQNGDFVQNFVGKYLYKLSSPTARFTPVTNLFTVTNATFATSGTFAGSVTNSGTNVPNASVILFQPGGDGLNPAFGCVANNSGAYSIKAPPGAYLLLAFKSNYLANSSIAPTITLTNGASITTNLAIIAANQSLSGKIADAANASVGLPGMFISVQSTNGLVGLGSTDTNGNFTARVTTNSWRLGGDSGAVGLGGYLRTQNSTKTNTFAGSVAGITALLPKATALFYGSVKTDAGSPLAAVHLYTSDQSNYLYEDNELTDVNGNYVGGALAGSWQLQIDNQNPNVTNYVFSDGISQTNLNAGTVVLKNFIAKSATNHITGYVRDSNNKPITNLSVYANASLNGTNYQALGVNTDTNGNYSLNVTNGTAWSVGVSCNGGDTSLDNILGNGSYQCPNISATNVSGGGAVVNIIVQLCNSVQITTASLPAGQAGTYYDQFLSATSCNNSFTWTPVSGSLPNGLTLDSNGEIFGTPTTSGTNNFTVQVTDGNNSSANQALTLVITANTNPPPPVYIGSPTSASNQVVVFYPFSGTNFALQMTTNLGSGIWVPATGGVPVMALIFTNTNPAVFYRLH